MEGSRALGIGFKQGNKQAEHPSSESVQALNRSGAGAWVDAVIQGQSDEISEPPAALREFVRDRREIVWSVIAALEKDQPDWGKGSDLQTVIGAVGLPLMRLERLLLAVALVEEYDGNAIDASRALEASWSLGSSLPSGRLLITQLVAIGVQRMQVGAVRKMQAPPLQWLGRLGSDGPWPRMLDAVTQEGRFRPPAPADGSRDASSEVAVKALSAIADALAKVSPCDLASMSDDEIWRPAAAALAAETDEVKRAFRDFYAQHMVESVASAIRRAARLEVDRELTLRVLQLRLEKDTSRDGRWPEKLLDATSAVCPAATYTYNWTIGGVELRFEGSVDVPKMGPVLPLAFRSRSPERAPTTASPPLTPSPEGRMMLPQ